MAQVEHLAWDTEFFGMPVVRIEGTGLSLDRLAAELDALKQHGRGLAYWFSSDLDAPTDAELVALGGGSADHRVTLAHPLDSTRANSATADVEVFQATKPTPSMRALAIEAGSYSRFRTDERFGTERFESLYSRWMDVSLTGELADTCLVVRDGEREIGLITVAHGGDCGRIGLMGVAPEKRQQGVASNLVHAALDDMVDHGCRSAEVVTQARNPASIQLYESCGFAIRSVERVYHFWL
jgi:dTDP-4-amino-4,6-dideoxy-D-galactose acyltransferase